MLFRQLFDRKSCTYTYLLAAGPGMGAVLIDPVREHVEGYLQLLSELGLTLALTLDTHVHADHVTGAGRLHAATGCATAMGARSPAQGVTRRLADGERVEVDGIALTALYTPGHTDDSYCYLMDDRVFTGDTLLIRGSGRTDFQNGCPHSAWRSITQRLLALPDATLVYPGHDYNGRTVSTIGEERRFNPRLKAGSEDAYVALMNGLNLPRPELIDEAVPANLRGGAD